MASQTDAGKSSVRVSAEGMSDTEVTAAAEQPDAAEEPNDPAPTPETYELNRLENSLEFKTPCRKKSNVTFS